MLILSKNNDILIPLDMFALSISEYRAPVEDKYHIVARPFTHTYGDESYNLGGYTEERAKEIMSTIQNKYASGNTVYKMPLV